MQTSYRIHISFSCLLFLAWIAKMHFVFGGDYLFRIGTLGILIALLMQTVGFSKLPELKSNRLDRLFIVNCIGLFIAYLGMMLKVSHLMDSQIEKDLVLDFIGIPAILISTISIFGSIEKLMEASKPIRVLFLRHIVLPWLLFLFSFMLYGVYSAILMRS